MSCSALSTKKRKFDGEDSHLEEEAGIPDPTSTEGRFRVRSKRVLLTFKTHIEPEVIDVWKATLGKYEPLLRAVHETGASGYKHTHVLLVLGIAPDLKLSDIEIAGIHPNLRVLRSDLHYDNVRNYLEKQGVSWGDDMPVKKVTKEKLRNDIQAGKSWVSVVNTLPIWSCMKWAKEVWEARPTPDQLGPVVLHQWQQDIENIILNPDPNENRLIRWYWEPTGNVGKSWFSKYLYFRHNACLMRGGKLPDMANVYREHSNASIVVFDLPRTDDPNTQHYLYRFMEQIKDGHVFCAKYASTMLITQKPPVIVVFANQEPEMYSGSSVTPVLSLDRWRITRIR